MERSFAKRCAAALWLMAAPAPAFAQSEDTQLWIYAIAIRDFEDDMRLTVDASARWREQARGDEQQTLRFNLETPIMKGTALGAGAGIFETGGTTELRPHQQLGLSFGRFSSRTRIEQRFFDGADQMEVRLRQRIGYAQPLGGALSASLEGEFLHIARPAMRASDQARDQWRGRFLLRADLSGQLALAGGYLAILTPQPDQTNRINHVPQAIISYRF